MKKLLLLAAFATVTAQPLFGATLALWTFESAYTNIGGTSTTLSGIPVDAGFGVASGVHASAAAWSSPAGNGSAHSLSVNTWALGDYFQFQTSTLGFSGIGLSYDQTSSGTGPGRFGLAYSTDGSIFTPITTSYTVLGNGTAPNPAWNAVTPSAAYTFTYDLSSITALDNAATVYFRLGNVSTISAGGGTVAVAGTDRIDNFLVYSPVPEPSTLSLVVVGGLAALLRRRK